MDGFISFAGHALLHTAVERTIHLVREKTRQTTFLNYDVNTLREWYRNEAAVMQDLPYTELDSYLPTSGRKSLEFSGGLTVTKATDSFVLATHPPANLSQLQTYAYDDFVREKRVDRDSSVVRLESYSRENRLFMIRQCRYSDGLKSNYAMDWHGKVKIAGLPFSLRLLMEKEYGSCLPPLNEARLSNALGLAVVVWHRTASGEILPYLPRRAEAGNVGMAVTKLTRGSVKRSAVFHGGFHCTASGEAEWRHGAETFDEIFTKDICKELQEEVGLEERDLEWIAPVALCREFLRGGKPQLFFCAYTELPERELSSRRLEAIEAQKKSGRQEIENDCLPVLSLEQVMRSLGEHGTVEGYTNMIYACQCMEYAVTNNLVDGGKVTSRTAAAASRPAKGVRRPGRGAG